MLKFLQKIAVLPILFSCSTDVDVSAEFYETPVIYSIIEPGQDFQYFRVQKAFSSGASGNANQLIKDPKNIYYDSGEIELNFKISDPENPDRPLFDFPLVYSRCDTCKESGDFYYDYLPIYHTYSFLPIDPESDKALVADLLFKNLETGHEARASIGLIPCFEIISPRWECSYENFQPTFLFDSLDIRLIGPEYAKVISVFMDVVYFEVPINGSEFEERTTEQEPWLVVDQSILNRDPGYEYSYKRGSNEFGQYLYRAVDTSNNKDIDYRVIQTAGVARFKFVLFDNEYYQYDLYTNNVSELQVSLAFTNIQNGLGLIASQLIREIPAITIEVEDKTYWDQFPSLKHF